ncbi:cytochrome c oxidase assembly factor Coa1 family protein [Christiangramia forsetii]|uniref:Membrane protein n=2 Tax=Christiangramia forsetii TaxID=411153 RepID=A0M737_CHRFK|nr:cytochrome c oxidase assembly factor Coa1 family protein [Christiangramia forsetii]GGG28795.1 hypothetical protein GCM10011532_10330 [Christiangramia forsetii]CAL68432.1 membrane protein [Christiangramia forsetii KT0803]
MKENWLNRNYKWSVPLVSLIIVIIYLFASSGFGKISSDLAQAYADKELYQTAIDKANKDLRVIETIGKIQPIDKMTILNGEVNYSKDNKSVTSTIKVLGDKGKAKLDLIAHRNAKKWKYEQLNIRVINPTKSTQTIEVIKSEK